MGPLDKFLGKAAGTFLTSAVGGTNILGLTIPDTLRVSFGAIGATTDQLSTKFINSALNTKIPNIGFIEAEMALSGTVEHTLGAGSGFIEIAQPGSKHTNDPVKIPDRYYPSYNEALGTFAVLNTPNVLIQNTITDPCGHPRDLPYKLHKFKFDKTAMSFYFNPAAEVNTSKTRIYAAMEFKVPNSLKINQYFKITGANFISNTGGYWNYVTDFYPIESLDRLIPTIRQLYWNGNPQTDIIVNLRLQIFYEFMPNRYGKTNTHWEIVTFPTTRTLTTTNLTGNLSTIPENITLGNTSYTTNTVVKAYGKITINGIITTTPGITVDYMAPEIINNSTSPLPGNVRLIISEFNIFGDTKMQPVTNAFVKSFCAATGQYKAKDLDPAARLAQQKGYNQIIEEEKKEKEFTIFPNPASNQVTLRFYMEEFTNAKITLIDISGKIISIVTDTTYDKGFHEINVETGNFSTGLYLAVFETSRNKVFKKLAVVR